MSLIEKSVIVIELPEKENLTTIVIFKFLNICQKTVDKNIKSLFELRNIKKNMLVNICFYSQKYLQNKKKYLTKFTSINA